MSFVDNALVGRDVFVPGIEKRHICLEATLPSMPTSSIFHFRVLLTTYDQLIHRIFLRRLQDIFSIVVSDWIFDKRRRNCDVITIV